MIIDFLDLTADCFEVLAAKSVAHLFCFREINFYKKRKDGLRKQWGARSRPDEGDGGRETIDSVCMS